MVKIYEMRIDTLQLTDSRYLRLMRHTRKTKATNKVFVQNLKTCDHVELIGLRLRHTEVDI
jgi:hypothetical protein